MKNIGIIYGSLRKGSFSKTIAQKFLDVLSADFNAYFIDISDLPLYNQDLDNDTAMPDSWKRFRTQLMDTDAFVFVTPEYNRSIPAALKNAIDVGSRPYTNNRWSKKPAALISFSPGSLGGFGANHHLRQVLTCVNVPTMQQPEAYLGGVVNSIKNGEIVSDDFAEFLEKICRSYKRWIVRFDD